jgi:hypothetical protein
MIVYFSIFWSLYRPIAAIILSVVAGRLRHYIRKTLGGRTAPIGRELVGPCDAGNV